MKIDSIRLGVASAITWAFGILLLGILVSCFHWGTVLMLSFSSVYMGYGPGLVGVIVRHALGAG